VGGRGRGKWEDSILIKDRRGRRDLHWDTNWEVSLDRLPGLEEGLKHIINLVLVPKGGMAVAGFVLIKVEDAHVKQGLKQVGRGDRVKEGLEVGHLKVNVKRLVGMGVHVMD